MSDRVEVVVDSEDEIGEGPVWNCVDGAIYWIDCLGSKLLAHDITTGLTRTWALGEYPGSFAFRENGRGVLMAFRRGMAFVRLSDDGECVIERLQHPMIDLARGRFNDGKCDRRGRFWVGQLDRFGKDNVGFLYRMDVDRSVYRMDGGVRAGNGICFSPDDRTMYFVESDPGLVYAYDFDLDAGVNYNKRIFLDYRSENARPDGCTVDVNGGLWISEVGGGSIARYRPDAKIDRRIHLPVSTPTSLTFGGPDLDTLFITSLRWRLSPDERKEHPLAGALLAVRPGMTGLPAYRFGG